MGVKRNALGATGANTARNVRHYRQIRNLSYAELSRRLDEVRWPIPPLGLRRIEAGQRRVEVDDLTALAVALDVGQLAFLLPVTSHDPDHDTFV